MVHRLKRFMRLTLDTRPWGRGRLRLLVNQVADRSRNERLGYTDAEHVRAAAEWLARAQDASTDGGFIGRYRLGSGWSSSYPETTGYLVPTLLLLARETQDTTWRDRAGRAVHFLLQVQLPSGAFPGGEVHENTEQPSVFNTAQILHGLTEWWTESRDAVVLAAARRAADWLCSVQDGDGGFRRHVYNGVVTSYTAYASCWLADFGSRLDEQRYVDAAVRHMEWALRHRDDDTGWIDLAGFTPEDHEARRSVTHTIAYTLWGLLHTGVISGRNDVIAAVRESAVNVARRLQLSGRLPAVLDHRWRGAADYECLTGNAQMALIWLRLNDIEGDGRLLNAALLALDLVKQTQSMSNPDPGVRGGIAGSRPVWGPYIHLAYPNWAAKYFIDAMYAAADTLRRLPVRPVRQMTLHRSFPSSPPKTGGGTRAAAGSAPLRTVLLTGPRSHKVQEMVTSWQTWGFRPTAVVIENPRPPSIRSRLLQRFREEGLSWVGPHRGTAGPATREAGSSPSQAWPDLRSFCRERQIPVIEVISLASNVGVEALRVLQPDLLVHAGAGILRKPLLTVPRLGALNAHMGILPPYRGMNVTEWAIFNRDTTGCTVHLIDPGVHTGDILCVADVPAHGKTSVDDVRSAVNARQIELLGEVVRYVLTSNTLPPRFRQELGEGWQFFRMHPLIRNALDQELSSRADAAG
jgi:hypothetical protein